MALLQGPPGNTAMHITRNAVMLMSTMGIGLAAGVLLKPYITSALAIHPELTLRAGTGAVATTREIAPKDIFQRAVQGSVRDKGLFLDNLLLALNTYKKPGAANGEYLKDFAQLYATLAGLLLDDSEYVAEPAASITNVLALMQRTTEIPAISESEAIKAALENVITHSEHDTVRGRAIDAWVLMYPPDETMIGTLETILQGDMDRFPESHAAAFRAYGIYKRRYGYKLPESTVATAKHLLEHPSQSVRVKAEYALAEMGGTSVLPTLITQLEQAGNSSEGRMLTALILSLDNSQATIDSLNRITAKAQ